MIPAEQMDLWFTYHRPTEVTTPKYQAIRAAHESCSAAVVEALQDAIGTSQKDFGTVNQALREFAHVINVQAPDSADKTAAIRCIRLARNAVNEVLYNINSMEEEMFQVLGQLVDGELHKARWQACAAIAIAEAEAGPLTTSKEE